VERSYIYNTREHSGCIDNRGFSISHIGRPDKLVSDIKIQLYPIIIPYSYEEASLTQAYTILNFNGIVYICGHSTHNLCRGRRRGPNFFSGRFLKILGDISLYLGITLNNNGLGRFTLFGLAYGFVIWLVFFLPLLMYGFAPVMMSMMGEMALSMMPMVISMGLLEHLIYGLSLGLTTYKAGR
jgi:hypothetical protein